MNQGERAQNQLPTLSRWARCLALLFVVGTSLGLFVWAVTHPDLKEPYLLSNVLSEDERRGLLQLMLLSGIGFCAGGLVHHRIGGLPAMERATARIAPLLFIGTVPFLLVYEHWVSRDITFLCLVLVLSLGTAALLQKALREDLYAPFLRPFTQSTLLSRLRLSRLSRSPRVPLVTVVTAALAYAAYFSFSTINNHNNFGTSAFDLGIETNLVWNTAHGGPLFRSSPLGGSMLHGGHHQTYFAFLIAPVFGLFPRAETLLIIQSCFLGAAAVPLFLLARLKLGSGKAVLLSCLLLLYGPMHGANLYDFHYQPFGVFFLLLIAYLFESQASFKVLLPLTLVTLSVREDMGAMLGALGGYFVLVGKRPKEGFALALLGSVYFVAMKLYVMPELFMNGRSSFAFMYKLLLPAGEEGFGGVLKTAIGNPVFTLDTVLTQEKLIYGLQIFVPLALLPLRRSVALVLFLPGVVFNLLSTQYPALIMTSFQYTSYFTPMVFLSTVYALEEIGADRDRTGRSARGRHVRQVAWLSAATLALLLTSLRYGSVFQVKTARGAFDPVHLRKTAEGEKNKADFQALAKRVPKDAKVAASEWLVSHLAARRDAYNLRNGVLDAEYILFWLHPTKFRSDERPVLMDALYSKNEFSLVARKGMFVLVKRQKSPGAPLPSELRSEISRAGTPRALAPSERSRPSVKPPARRSLKREK